MDVWVPAARPMARRPRPAAFMYGAALAVGCALVLGTVAAFASGSPNPKVWIREAEQTIGIPSTVSAPSPDGAAPESTATPEESPAAPSGGERESTSPSAPEQESPHPESPAAAQSPDPSEHSPTGSPGDG